MFSRAALATATVPPVTVDMLVVFAIVLLALGLFVSEAVPVDVTAILVMVALMVLEPWTGVGPAQGLSGFSSTATITVLAMLILSAGVDRTGIVQLLGQQLAAFAGENPDRQLAATIGIAGPISGLLNNTPVVAILVPVVSDLAHKGKTSPSKLLMPLSYASMLGGTLTLLGTSTNILASAVAERIASEREVAGLHGFSMFEFTQLGAIVLVVGSAYLLLIGPRLIPSRIPPEEDYFDEYEIRDYVTEVVVLPESPLIDQPVQEAFADRDVDALQLVRDGEQFIEPLGQKVIQQGDILKVRTDRGTLEEIMSEDVLALLGSLDSEEDLEPSDVTEQTLVEVVIHSGSSLIGETLSSTTFRQRFDANVLAFRSRGETLRSRIDEVSLRVGDTLLIQAPADSIDRLAENPEFIVGHEPERPNYRREKVPHAAATILGVVGVAAFTPIHVVVSALAGVLVMVATGVLRPAELYEAVDWNVVFLLAGIIPLGLALENTGAAELLGALVASTGDYLPVIGVLWVFYAATVILTNVVSNNASVVLMIPVAVQTALDVNANPFAFVLAVTFAASTAFLSPVGYQTNLFVYGPGGYRFADYARLGAPLQVILSVVTVAGIAFFWGLAPPA